MSGEATAAPRPPTIREWVRDHDEKWLFVVIYLGLAVGLSVFVSLFWLLAVAVLHFGLEVARQAHYRDGKRTIFLHALWEVKLDIGLILLALALVLYIEVVLGLLGLQSAARAAAVSRAGVRIGSRAAAWERNLRTFLLTVDEMARIVHAAVTLKKKGKKGKEVASAEGEVGAAEGEVGVAEEEVAVAEGEVAAAEEDIAATEEDEGEAEAPPEADPAYENAWSGKWGIGDRIGVLLVVAGAVFIVLAPYMTDHDWASAGTMLLEELHPFPGEIPEN